ncbi:MAG: hypothetical protein B6D36_09925 [Planctomycetes bacterium UTPLA1]|nr:MAG: hypothetical protein B6D36_09925 [Planctomycetes bacterium UTPLA1]
MSHRSISRAISSRDLGSWGHTIHCFHNRRPVEHLDYGFHPINPGGALATPAVDSTHLSNVACRKMLMNLDRQV